MRDPIEREDAINAIYHHFPDMSMKEATSILHEVPSAFLCPERVDARPCYYVKFDGYIMKDGKVDGVKSKKIKALWHKWFMRDGNTYALVEFEDGYVCELRAYDIQFADGMSSGFIWEGETDDD